MLAARKFDSGVEATSVNYQRKLLPQTLAHNNYNQRSQKLTGAHVEFAGGVVATVDTCRVVGRVKDVDTGSLSNRIMLCRALFCSMRYATLVPATISVGLSS